MRRTLLEEAFDHCTPLASIFRRLTFVTCQSGFSFAPPG